MSPLLVLLAALAMVVCFSSPASAANYTVKIKKIATKTATYKKAVKVMPAVTVTGKVKISSKRLTVKKGKKKIRTNVTFANLKAGSYKLTTTVKYRPYSTSIKSRTVNKTTVYQPGDAVQSSCVVTAASAYDGSLYGAFAATCTAAGSGATFPIDGAVTGNGAGQWLLDTYLDQTHTLSAASWDALVGQRFEGVFTTWRTLTVTRPSSERYTAYSYGKTYTKTTTQTLKIKQGKKPKKASSTSPRGWNCPASAPIKGNASSHIYHVPGSTYYSRTKPEICFSSQSAARHAGYRAPRR